MVQNVVDRFDFGDLLFVGIPLRKHPVGQEVLRRSELIELYVGMRLLWMQRWLRVSSD